MSGHSKWATTKHKKAVIDSRRAKNFAKLIKAIEVASRNGGPDMDGNPTLFDAVAKAKKNSMPADNIDRAIKRGAGLESGGANWETIMYEGYGPAGVAIMIECLSDNRNRAASEVRVAVTRNGGSMADPGSVSYLFHRKGLIVVNKSSGATEESILEAVIERARLVGVERIFCLTFETQFFSRHGFQEIHGTPVDPDVYSELLRSYDTGVAEFLDLESVKPNTLGNTRMLKVL